MTEHSSRSGLTAEIRDVAAVPERPDGGRRRSLARLYGAVPLTLITGPANAAKAGAVLDRLRALRAREPLLVVPTSADVDHYRRELAAEGIVFGAEVVTFRRLVRELAAAAGLRGRPLGRVARERVVRAAVRGTPAAGAGGVRGRARASPPRRARCSRSCSARS